jgi:hypothetical protein
LIEFHIRRVVLPVLVTALAAAGSGAARAGGSSDYLVPLTSNTSSAMDWRITAGQQFNGVAALDATVKLSWANAGSDYTCSGSLLAGGAYILTAGHCADGLGSATLTVNFGFSNGSAALTRTATAADVTLNPLWRGFGRSADAGTDLALIKLSEPVAGIAGYHLSPTSDFGKTVLMAGFGNTGSGDSATAPGNADAGYGHFAFNRIDVDSRTFNLAMNAAVPIWDADPDFYTGATYMYDFDDASNPSARNTLQRVADISGNAWRSDAGVNGEGLIASGDSGGGDFVWNGSEWLLSAVHSWGWQGNSDDGTGLCDFLAMTDCSPLTGNSSSYGDLSGSTAVFDQTAWIASVAGEQVIAVPEPTRLVLSLAGLIALLGVRQLKSSLTRGVAEVEEDRHPRRQGAFAAKAPSLGLRRLDRARQC